MIVKRSPAEPPRPAATVFAPHPVILTDISAGGGIGDSARQGGIKMRSGAVAATSETVTRSRAVRFDDSVRPLVGRVDLDDLETFVYDVVFVLLTVALFAALAWIARAVERL
jgi:hypothetical protein